MVWVAIRMENDQQFTTSENQDTSSQANSSNIKNYQEMAFLSKSKSPTEIIIKSYAKILDISK